MRTGKEWQYKSACLILLSESHEVAEKEQYTITAKVWGWTSRIANMKRAVSQMPLSEGEQFFEC